MARGRKKENRSKPRKKGAKGGRKRILAFILLSFVFGVALSVFYLYPRGAGRVKSPENIRTYLDENDRNLVESLKEEESAGRILDSEGIRGKICLVMDDVGYEGKRAESFIKQGVPVTVAVLPGGRFSKRIARLAKSRGNTVLLHMPMVPDKKIVDNSKKFILDLGMGEREIISRLEMARRWVPGISGISNHMGSRFTRDPGGVKVVASYMKQHGLFFLDSRTTPKSVIPFVCRVTGVNYLERDVFIDNSHEPDKIRAQFERLKNIASGRGFSIGIFHPGKVVTDHIGELIRESLLEGYRFVTLKDVLEGE